jgi:hypothetical protein
MVFMNNYQDDPVMLILSMITNDVAVSDVPIITSGVFAVRDEPAQVMISD